MKYIKTYESHVDHVDQQLNALNFIKASETGDNNLAMKLFDTLNDEKKTKQILKGLILAASNGNLELLQYAFSKNPKINPTATNSISFGSQSGSVNTTYNSLLLAAVENNKMPVVKFLLSLPKCNVTANQYEAVRHCIHEGKTKMLKTLVDSDSFVYDKKNSDEYNGKKFVDDLTSFLLWDDKAVNFRKEAPQKMIPVAQEMLDIFADAGFLKVLTENDVSALVKLRLKVDVSRGEDKYAVKAKDSAKDVQLSKNSKLLSMLSDQDLLYALKNPYDNKTTRKKDQHVKFFFEDVIKNPADLKRLTQVFTLDDWMKLFHNLQWHKEVFDTFTPQEIVDWYMQHPKDIRSFMDLLEEKGRKFTSLVKKNSLVLTEFEYADRDFFDLIEKDFSNIELFDKQCFRKFKSQILKKAGYRMADNGRILKKVSEYFEKNDI